MGKTCPIQGYASPGQTGWTGDASLGTTLKGCLGAQPLFPLPVLPHHFTPRSAHASPVNTSPQPSHLLTKFRRGNA